MPATTKAEQAARLEELRRIRSQGASDFRLRRYAQEKWGLSQSGGWRLVAKLREEMVAEYRQIDHADLNTRLIAQCEDVLAQAIASKQFPSALGAIRLLAELTGLTKS